MVYRECLKIYRKSRIDFSLKNGKKRTKGWGIFFYLKRGTDGNVPGKFSIMSKNSISKRGRGE